MDQALNRVNSFKVGLFVGEIDNAGTISPSNELNASGYQRKDITFNVFYSQYSPYRVIMESLDYIVWQNTGEFNWPAIKHIGIITCHDNYYVVSARVSVPDIVIMPGASFILARIGVVTYM